MTKVLSYEGSLLSEAEEISEIENKKKKAKDIRRKIRNRTKVEEIGKSNFHFDSQRLNKEENYLAIKIPQSFTREKLVKLYKILKDHPGKTPVILIVQDKEGRRKMKLPMRVKNGRKLMVSLNNLLEDGK